jgi:hypothetical protein
VNQLDGDEVIARQLEHAQTAEYRPLYGPGHRVANGYAERQ